MYKVLVVDDEQIIRDGIAKLIPWQKHGLTLHGVAENGLVAWEIINATPPHIVITDIKMPGLDGLGLIERAYQLDPKIKFVVLSGYGEFELAKAAMRYGVKHYLLKPCNEQRIEEALAAVLHELHQSDASEAVTRQEREKLENVLPLVKEQFLREWILFQRYTTQQYQYYVRMLGLEEGRWRMAVWAPQGGFEKQQLQEFQMRIRQFLDDDAYLDSIHQNRIVSLFSTTGEQEALSLKMQELQKQFLENYQKEVKVAYSEPFEMNQAVAVFRELSHALPETEAPHSCEGSEDSEGLAHRTHKMIEILLHYVRDNLSDENLSLKWLANEVAYMNEGYLSKLFLKETGEKFSRFLLRLRMEKAKELIAANGTDRIYEVAQSVGLGNNPQYFSQLFKKYAGCPPSEYKKHS